MELLRVAFRHGAAVVFVAGAPVAAMAQAALASPSLQQERCIEAFADTQEEKAIREAMGEAPKEIVDGHGLGKRSAQRGEATAFRWLRG